MAPHPHNPTPLIASSSHPNTQPNPNNNNTNYTRPSSKLNLSSALQETLSTLTDSLGSILSPRTTSVHEKDRSSSVLGSESRVAGTPSFKHTGKKPGVEVEESGGALGFF